VKLIADVNEIISLLKECSPYCLTCEITENYCLSCDST
jgi:hypothetical protein